MPASRAASVARRRDRAASSLTTTAVKMNTTSATQFPESERRNVYTGSRKKKLNASIEAIAAATPKRVPQITEIGSTASR